MRTCQVCNKEFKLEKVCGKKRKYCNPKCSKIANNNKTKKNYRKKRNPYQDRYCLLCGKKLPNRVGIRGVKPRYCEGECTLLYKAYRSGNIDVLFGSLVVENDDREKNGLYSMTVEEMAKHFNQSETSMREELNRTLFKFKSVFEEYYGKPEFDESDNDCWDQLYNYIIEEEDHAPNPL